MICPAGQGPHLSETKPVSLSNDPPRRGGRGPYLPETTRCAGWLETGSKSSTGRFLIHMDAQDAQDFFGRRLACIPGHPQIRTRSSPESAFRAAASGPNYPVHPVHPCSIYSPSRLIFPVAGLGCAQRPDSQSASRAAASGPINPVPWVAAQFPCDVAADRPAGGNRMGPAEAELGRRCRSIRVEEMGEAIPGFVRAGRPRSRVAFSPNVVTPHDVVTPPSQYCRSIWAALFVEAGLSVFGSIRVDSCPFVVRFRQRAAVKPGGWHIIAA